MIKYKIYIVPAENFTYHFTFWKVTDHFCPLGEICREMMAYLAIAHPMRGRSMFPTAQATQATPMTNPRCLMSHISVVMFNGLWNSGNIAPKAMICVTEKRYVNEREVEVLSLRQNFTVSFKKKSSP